MHDDESEEARRGRDCEHRHRDEAEDGRQRVEQQAVVDDAVAPGVPVVVPGRPAVHAEDARLVAVGRVVDAAQAGQADHQAEQAGDCERQQDGAVDARHPGPLERKRSGG